jgi:GntR family transcriptional regulator
MVRRRDEIRDALRRRILNGLREGSLERGDRLPSARQVATQLDADPRVVLAAYRVLASEGLVELRERSGIFVASSPDQGTTRPPAVEWLAEVLAQGVAREVPAQELGRWLTRVASPAGVRAAVLAATSDQAEGIRRELHEYYGIDAVSLPPGAPPVARVPAALRAASLIVATDGLAAAMRRVGARLGIPVVAISVRADLVGPEWRLLLRNPVYVVVTDHRFVQTLRHFFADTPGVDNLHPIVLGRDSLDAIPPGAATYVTHSARAQLGDAPIPGRIVPPARIFSEASAREILRVLIMRNLEGEKGRKKKD